MEDRTEGERRETDGEKSPECHVREEEASCGIMAIDLKSFYASCECVERGLDPMDAYLVVADGRASVYPEDRGFLKS